MAGKLEREMQPFVTKVAPLTPKDRNKSLKMCIFSAFKLARLNAFAYHPPTLIEASL